MKDINANAQFFNSQIIDSNLKKLGFKIKIEDNNKYLKNLFNCILKEDKNNLENFYDWDNKTLNTSTTNNTSQKAFLVKDKDKLKKEMNIFENRHNKFIDIKNVLDNEINEFEEKINKPKIDKIEDNKFSMKEPTTFFIK
ncbi:MAG: hypothetical protein II833_08130, partial [Pseudobutyrivibrio sp.]|nr:hypothetical protein [Pseudobutyrivibrio sp.]